MSLFTDIFPEVDTLLQLEPEDIGPLMLKYLNETNAQALVRYNFVSSGFAGEVPGYAGSRLPEVQRVLSEGWTWLEREGLLSLAPNNPSEHAYIISRRGQQLRTQTDFEVFKRGSFLSHRTLDPVLAQKVTHLFIRGDYDTAVFQAFKEVEVRTRQKANLPPEKLGVDLMRAAFNAEDGALTNKALPKGEREACANLFAGAIGMFKNPASHRDVGTEAEEARELVLFANYLLRMIERS